MKKIISTAMAAVMMLSMVSPFGARFYAEDLPQATAVEATGETAATLAEEQEPAQNNAPAVSTNETAGEDSAVEKVAELFAALPKAEDVLAMSEEERQAIMAMMTEAINAYDALSAEEGAAFLAKYGALYDAVTGDLMAALLSAGGNDTSDLSLQPMEETEGVYLTLFGYSADQLKNFPVDDIPDMLTDELGNPIDVADGYTGAWFYFAEDDVDESHALGVGETVDLWDYDYSADSMVSTSYTMYLVLGNGKQMNDGNSHRYIISVEICNSNKLWGSFSARLSSSASLTSKMQNDIFATLGMEGSSYTFYDLNYSQGKQYTISLDSSYDTNELKRYGVKADVYPMGDFLRYRDEGAELTGAITEQVFGNGVTDTYDTKVTIDNYKTAKNLWCIVFTQEETGRILGYIGVIFNVTKASDWIQTDFRFFNGSSMDELGYSRVYGYSASVNYNIDFSSTGNGVTHSYYQSSYGVSISLPEEYALDETYYVTLKKNPDIKAVYAGSYQTEASAIRAGAANITNTIIADAGQGVPYGYKVTLGSNQFVTLVLQDGAVFPLFFYGYHSGGGSGSGSLARNDLDPNFQISGIRDENNKTYEYYIADMVRGVQLDTYYRRDDRYDVGGYQMVLLNEELSEDELKKAVPEFWTPTGVQVNSGGKVVSGETNLVNAVWSDAIENTVMYQVQVPGEKLRNYQVTFATRQQEAKLLVAGPNERFVNLTADNNFVHDILVANIGATELTGVTVELKNPVHVKLDSYWTIGGNGNDTIPAFDGIYPEYTVKDEAGQGSVEFSRYATLDNIAKVRLIADGEGEISGTLVITAANGDRREIKLTGIAANPHIVSATLEEAVKFVPYSYMVVTDNMYRWNRTSFKLIDGKLPAGMQLYEATGEIYGTPTETGDFTFTVQADYSSSRFSPSQATYTLHVADNTNIAVYNQTDEGYSIKVPLGVEQGDGTRDFYLADTSTDQLYVSNGVYPEFVDVWLNGQKLIYGLDYTSESGSTRITIRSQTFATKAYTDRYNTIAAEFRVDGDRNNELKRTAQNFRLTEDMLGESGGSGSNANQSSGSSSGTQTTVNTVDLGQVPENAAGVTLRFYVVDGNGSPVVGATAELHSTPRYGTTDGAGCVVFSNVEFGSHTLTIYDANGNVMGGKSFVLAHGGFGVDGSVITVSDGALVDITVKAENGTLQFTNTTLAQGSAAIPQTGDDFEPQLWLLLAVLSACMATGMTIYKKKKDQV